MKERKADKERARSSVTGNVIKMKVRKTSEDKQVIYCCHQEHVIMWSDILYFLILCRGISTESNC
jgi:hypothetical protein